MEKKIIAFCLISLFFIVGFSGCIGPQATGYFNSSYLVDEETILNVTNINGQVVISGWDGDNVSVSAVKRSYEGELDKIVIDVSSIGNYLVIETKYTGLSSFSVDMTINVPRFIHIQSVTSSNGGIIISDVKGDINATSSNGAININNVNGYVSAQTSNAHVEVRETTGVRDIRSSNAAITVDISDIIGNTIIETSNGAINVYINPSLNATIDMRTSNSKINVEGISLNVSTLENTHVLGTIGSNGHRLNISTSNANILLTKLIT